jgi:DNA ligase-1
VQAFAGLLEALVFAPQRNAKIRLIRQYLSATADPHRGWGLAALAGDLAFAHAKPALVRALVAERIDPVLFALSYDFVGDLAETVALIWPARATATPTPLLAEVVETMRSADRLRLSALIEGWLDSLDAGGRHALLKLITGGLRVGVSSRLAKVAAAGLGRVEVEAVEEMWHGLAPPYRELFDWLEGRSVAPVVAAGTVFRPMMLAHPLDAADLGRLDPADFAAEWKWDGIRVQAALGRDGCRVFSRTGDDITAAFPELAAGSPCEGVVDGELLIVRDDTVAAFNDLQQRLGRKTASKALLARHPAHIRAYDLLFDGVEDLRPLPFDRRRRRLEAWIARARPVRFDLSPLIPFLAWEELAALRADSRDAGSEGLMLKRRDSAYVAGRPKGLWYKWKRDPLTADCVLMYAQRGHGRRSSYYSDFTFGCWQADSAGGRRLVPVGKAYFGFTDAELAELDRWVRTHTVERFGPVRAVEPALVLEIAFDAVQSSSRHRSGIAMRFPRVHRIRWDKPAAEADEVASLRAMAATPAAVETAG